ncbi:MAG: sulfurtransferase TusA family protein [Deltaproteobacteria bacterium]|jgi:TusA-related sulfurtransferase
MKRKQTKQGIDGDSEFEGTVDHILDLRGMIIPLTFLKITQGLRRIKPGETLQIMVSDPDTRRDFFKVLATFPYEVLNTNEGENLYLVRLRKSRA